MNVLMSPVIFRILVLYRSDHCRADFPICILENVPAALVWVYKYSAVPQWFEVGQSRRTEKSGDSGEIIVLPYGSQGFARPPALQLRIV
jgi:hypothetical protein